MLLSIASFDHLENQEETWVKWELLWLGQFYLWMVILIFKVLNSVIQAYQERQIIKKLKGVSHWQTKDHELCLNPLIFHPLPPTLSSEPWFCTFYILVTFNFFMFNGACHLGSCNEKPFLLILFSSLRSWMIFNTSFFIILISDRNLVNILQSINKVVMWKKWDGLSNQYWWSHT